MTGDRFAERPPNAPTPLGPEGGVTTSPQAVRSGGDYSDFDLVIVGSGSAGFAAAIRARSLGATVALVEASTVGGTCVNVGCIPSKALLAAAGAYRAAGHHPYPGVVTNQVGVDMAALVAGKDEVVTALRNEKYVELAAAYGFEILHGHGVFSARRARRSRADQGQAPTHPRPPVRPRPLANP